MNKILVIAVLTPLVIAVGTTVLAHRARQDRRMMDLSHGVIIFGTTIAAICIVLGFTLYSLERQDYRECIRSVEDSQGDREWDEAVVRRFRLFESEVRATGIGFDSLIGTADELGTLLDQENPRRTVAECDALKP